MITPSPRSESGLSASANSAAAASAVSATPMADQIPYATPTGIPRVSTIPSSQNDPP